MALEDVANRLVTNGVAQMPQGAGNAIIPPGTMFLRHADDQYLHLLGRGWAPEGLTLRRAVHFARRAGDARPEWCQAAQW